MPAIAGHQAAVPLWRDERRRRRRQEARARLSLVGRRGVEVAEAPAAAARALGGVEEREAAVTIGADRVSVELERGHDAEVAAAAAQRPEQLGVLVLARMDPLAGRRDELDRGEGVAGQAVARSSQPEPPPSVSPATPVLETRPPVVASPYACVRRSNSAHVAPAPSARPRRAGRR